MSSLEQCRTITLDSGAIIKIAPLCTLEQIPASHAAASSCSSQRLREGYTWRTLARAILGDSAADFSYNPLGAPQINNSELYISVSHSATLAAVIISPRPCAIDIELLTRNFERVATRYISPREEQLPLPREELLASLWSIKETLYKYAGRKEINLAQDLEVTGVDKSRFTALIHPCEESIHGEIAHIANHTVTFIG